MHIDDPFWIIFNARKFQINRKDINLLDTKLSGIYICICEDIECISCCKIWIFLRITNLLVTPMYTAQTVNFQYCNCCNNRPQAVVY